MRPLSILVFPQKRYPSDHATLEEVYSKLLPARGHRVTFVMQAQPGFRVEGEPRWNGAEVRLLPAFPGRLPAARAARAVAWAPHRAFSLDIARQVRPDIVQVRNEVAGALVAAHLQFWHKIPFVYQISFPVIEGTATAAGLGLTRYRRLQLVRAGGMVRLQRRLMRSARLVLPISETMKDDLAAVGVPRERMLTFPLGGDTSVDPDRVDGSGVRRRLGLEDAPVVLYFGALDRLRGLEFLLEAFGIVAAERPDVRLVMLGRAANPGDIEALKATAGELGIAERVVFAGGVPRAEVNEYLAASSFTLSPYPGHAIYRSVSPTKLMESLAMARAVVGNDVSEQGQIIRESGAGEVAAYEPAAFAAGMLRLLANPAATAEMGRRGRAWVQANRSWGSLADRIEAAYAGILGDRAG